MKGDYTWVSVLVVLIVAALLWKPVSGLFRKVEGTVTDQDAAGRGKLVFEDVERWGGPGSYMSCAMCHDPAFAPAQGKEVTMKDYKPGEPLILKDLSNKYKASMLESSDALYEQAMLCLTSPTRINGGRVSANAKFVEDLLAYLRKQ